MEKFYTVAEAEIKGSEKYPHIKGNARFTRIPEGTRVTVVIKGLPVSDKKCGRRIFAVHIHEGSTCKGNKSDPFADAKGHYNPDGCQHPFHAGDLPPIFSSDGTAAASYIIKTFTPSEVIGKTIIIHSNEDDFHTQPSGNSGEKIACGVIHS